MALEDQLRDYKEQAEETANEYKKFQAIADKLQFDIDELSQQVEQADAARTGLREQLQESNEKMITLEEDLYEQKQVNRDLVK